MISLRLPYLNIDINTYLRKRRSSLSTFRTLFSKKSFGHHKIMKIYKRVGVKLNCSPSYKSLPLSLLRSFNSVARTYDDLFFIKRSEWENKRRLRARKNLKYYLALHNLPRNGQRTRNNGKTAKRLGFDNSILKSIYKPRKKRVDRKVEKNVNSKKKK